MSSTSSAFAHLRTLAAELNRPALLPPPNTESHLTTHSPEQKWYYVCAVLYTVIPGLFISLRIYTKIRIVRKMDVTDYLAVTAFLMFIPMMAIGRVMIHAAVGVHQWNVRYRDLFTILYWMNINEIIYGPVILLIKLAILLQYLRLLAPNRSVNRSLYFGAWIIIVLNTTFYIATTFVTIFLCRPRELIWNKFLQEGQCINQEAPIMFTALFNIISDIAILILPIKTIWGLQIPTRKKIGISLLFATGSLACFANVLVILFLVRMSGEDADVSFNAAWMGLAGCAEIAFGIIVTCMLSLPKFFDAKGKWLLGLLYGLSRPFTLMSTRSGSSNNGSITSRGQHSESALVLPLHHTQVVIPKVRLGQTLSETELEFITGDVTPTSR
ncbi:hypothetical protein CC86DRAFT_399514 [Ophiobolus disseminans]|uniref:Rhodopsin domain-containing protein n=1 Tax=Ophiobolus disseminans TaxID=1469910 RepID=A0A6A7AJG1_9PLEO|nr:hypothetical protein CC86DRAFT_399514 [Ophiobolus disseminans]